MKFTSFLHKKLVDLLGDRRIVVWYNDEGDFKAFASEFNAPNCEVLSADASILKTRRRADEIYRLMNESENPSERDRCLLIYIPRRRGAGRPDSRKPPARPGGSRRRPPGAGMPLITPRLHAQFMAVRA